MNFSILNSFWSKTGDTREQKNGNISVGRLFHICYNRDGIGRQILNLRKGSPMSSRRIQKHPILPPIEQPTVNFFWQDNPLV
ncbi:MAG: hypothetical protein ACK4SN_09200, partial [Bellilinea sp.]